MARMIRYAVTEQAHSARHVMFETSVVGDEKVMEKAKEAISKAMHPEDNYMELNGYVVTRLDPIGRIDPVVEEEIEAAEE